MLIRKCAYLGIMQICHHLQKVVCSFNLLLADYPRLQTSVPVSTSFWPGSTQSSRSVSATPRSAGPRSTSLESRTCAPPATPWTPGWTTPLRCVVMTCCCDPPAIFFSVLSKGQLFIAVDLNCAQLFATLHYFSTCPSIACTCKIFVKRISTGHLLYLC